MSFVLDSSVTMAWILSDEANAGADELLESLGKGDKAYVPALWRWEVANVLLMVERKKRASKAEVSKHLVSLISLPIEVDEFSEGQVWSSAFLLAQKHLLTSYDSSYLELALRRGLPLASLDSALRTAATAEKVKILPAKV